MGWCVWLRGGCWLGKVDRQDRVTIWLNGQRGADLARKMHAYLNMATVAPLCVVHEIDPTASLSIGAFLWFLLIGLLAVVRSQRGNPLWRVLVIATTLALVFGTGAYMVSHWVCQPPLWWYPGTDMPRSCGWHLSTGW